MLGLSVGAKPFNGRLPKLSLDIKGRIIAIPDNYDADNRLYSGIWSGEFARGWTDNPAWIIYDLLTSKQWGLGLSGDLIDKFDLYRIAVYCDEMIASSGGEMLPRFSFNAMLTKRLSAARVIADICASIQAMFFWAGGRLRFIQDRDEPPRLLVSNSSVIDGRFVYHGRSEKQQYSHALVT